jgi:CMP-N-acetylneuraminic acid synthetase
MASAPSTPKIVALVPMKHTSVRVRGKNYRMFQGQPLCYWVLKTTTRNERPLELD